jgi:hypothetical protein
MKQFSNYQYVEGEPMSERDKQEVGSKFWNEGKWKNFVVPFLPKNCSDMTLIDMGCNAGLFLKLAKDRGFKNAIGVDSNEQVVRRGLRYCDSIKADYQIIKADMRICLDKLPVSDFTVLANSHYYFTIDSWLRYLDKLRNKNAHCIIVTAEKRVNNPKASANVDDIRDYFEDWVDLGMVEPSLEGDPYPRKLWGLCFKNTGLYRVDIDSLDIGNKVQGGFYKELDQGVHPYKTRYFRIMNPYRQNHPHNWSERRVKSFFKKLHLLWEDVKKNGLLNPVIVNKNDRIVDGNHRCQMMSELGYKSVLIRRVP